MPLKKITLAISAIAMTAGLAFAQDPISERQAAMKSVGGAAKVAGQMTKGEIDFDAAAALAALQKMNDVAKVYATYFPEGSETGGETTAAPAIWTDKAGFEAAIMKFETDTQAAIDASPADLDAFKVAFGNVAKNCGACHETYRVKKN